MHVKTHTHKKSQGNETEEKGFKKRKVFKGYAKSTMTTAYCVCGGGEGKGGGSKSGS